jgi:putative FmdB family regulatory protein
MPIYEYRCPECDELFELRRRVAEAGDDAKCSSGHPGGRRLLSRFATTGKATDTSFAGGCGAGCACAAAAASSN